MKIKREKPKRSLSRRLVLAVDAFMNHILLLLAALVFLFGFYALWDANQVYSQASSSEYEAYRPVSTSEKDELASFSGFHKLQQVNPEVLGWINVYGTNIDYPLVQAKDNEKYLNKDSKGEFAATGAIFLEARNESKFEDFNTIIYGHHVENGVMFGDVAKFSDKEFFDQHPYGSIYYNGVEKGLETAYSRGIIAGYPIVDVKATLTFGSYHDVDSSELAFKLPASLAFKAAFAKANPVLLEPIMKVQISAPTEFQGNIFGLINQRRGIIGESTDENSASTVNAEVPLSEMFGFSTILRSSTQGKGEFTMEFEKYGKVPNAVAEELIKKYQEEKKAGNK